MIKLENLYKIYKMGDVQVNALNGINHTIKNGEFVSIMGPSGSGKSTMLHMIGILDLPTSGSVTINGHNISKMTDEERTKFRLQQIGFVFQFYSLLPELTSIENVMLPGMIKKNTSDAQVFEAKSIMEKLGLENRLGNYPHQLSGGEQQRVSIARALINNPQLLLADEPTASLDSKSALNVIKTLRSLNEESGQTIVLITHEQNLGRMANRGLFLKDGEIEKETRF